MTLGFNNIGFGMGNMYPTIDHQVLNKAQNGFTNQINMFSDASIGGFTGFAGFAGFAQQNTNWVDQAANAFSFNGAPQGNATFSTAVTNPFNAGTTPAAGTTTTTTTGTTPAAGATTTTASGPADPNSKVQKEANEICEELYVAMKGAGTDEKALDAALAKINKDNVLEVMETYVRLYSDAMDGETLVESIQNEFHAGWFSNKLEKITQSLADKLAERATDMGLDGEGKACKAKVKAENNSWWNVEDEKVALSINTLLAAMIAQRG